MVLINKARLLEWFHSLIYEPKNEIAEWLWHHVPEYSHVEDGVELRAIHFINKDMSDARLIFFELEIGTDPSPDQVAGAIRFLNTES
jgi:hypothetical protein